MIMSYEARFGSGRKAWKHVKPAFIVEAEDIRDVVYLCSRLARKWGHTQIAINHVGSKQYYQYHVDIPDELWTIYGR